MQKTLRLQYYLSTSPRLLTPSTEGRWSKCYSSMASPKRLAAIMMLCKNMIVKVCFLDGDADYFDIIAGVLQGDRLVLCLFICLDYVLRISIDKMEDKSFKLAKERSRKYPAQPVRGADYTDGIALLANAPTKTETLLHSLEWAAAGIGPHNQQRPDGIHVL